MKILVFFILLLLVVLSDKSTWAQEDAGSEVGQELETQSEKEQQISATGSSDDDAKTDAEQELSDRKNQPVSQVKKTASSNNKKENSKDSTSRKNNANKVFIPTEEISEDKPVAFPVDI